ncbi:hypothetical protein [uncultured Phycicoccus sp.]|uniref:hypothetical protein n=1 Tax=uncultured Phycicoccus sp. TaxID=661422 RepID=UPI002610167B|nr:hypothetical protein [uncultured Phycicoccus sp.]
MTAQRWPQDAGSVAEEAARLLESLRRVGGDPETSDPAGDPPPAADGRGAAPGGSADPWAEAGADTPHGGPAPRADAGFTCTDPVCQWCPVCRASAFIRQLSPETLSGLAEFAGFAATVLADLASARERAERPDGHHDE